MDKSERLARKKCNEIIQKFEEIYGTEKGGNCILNNIAQKIEEVGKKINQHPKFLRTNDLSFGAIIGTLGGTVDPRKSEPEHINLKIDLEYFWEVFEKEEREHKRNRMMVLFHEDTLPGIYTPTIVTVKNLSKYPLGQLGILVENAKRYSCPEIEEQLIEIINMINALIERLKTIESEDKMELEALVNYAIEERFTS